MTKSMCVWYWLIFLPYVCPFLKKYLAGRYIDDFVTKHHVIKAVRVQTKSRNGAIVYRTILPYVGYLFCLFYKLL